MRVALQIVPVLEGARLAFVDVHRHQPRRGFGAHDAPLAACREACAAQATQAAVLHLAQHRLDVARAVHALPQQRVAPLREIGVQPHMRRRRCGGLTAARQRDHRIGRGPRQRLAAHRHRGRLLAAADARCGDDAHVAAQHLGQALQQVARPGHLAGQTSADAHRQRRRRCLAFLDDVEVVVERCHLEDLGHRQPQFLRQCRQMRRRQMAQCVLQPMQVFDQQFAAARRISQQALHLGQRRRVHTPPLRRLPLALPIEHRRDDRQIGHGGRASARLRSPGWHAMRTPHRRHSPVAPAPRRCARRAVASGSPRSGCRSS